MTARVVNGKIGVASDLADGTEVAVLAADGEAFSLTADQELELESALAQIRNGEFVDGRELLRDLRGSIAR